jgi:dTDP-4-amino-4,6-dideoxygalactose transaminase
MSAAKTIQFIDLAPKFQAFAAQFHRDLDRVLSSGSYILGAECARLEASVKDFARAEHAIAVANGTDALILSLKAAGVGPGDEVITTPMSYLATTSSIALCGANAVFVDVDAGLNLDPDCIEDAITDRTRAISVVHLAGIPAQIERIVDIGDRHGLAVIEDCAQSFGASCGDRLTGTFGRFGTLSFHPLKNLGTLGDGGMILAQRTEDANWMRQARNHGHRGRDECDFWTINSRLDELHAAFLSSMLKSYPEELARRRCLANIYRTELAGVVEFPAFPETSSPSYNWIMILADRREELIVHLANHGIEVKVHYPALIPDLKAAARNCRIHGNIANARRMVQRILSVPMAEHVSEDDARLVCDRIKDFYG